MSKHEWQECLPTELKDDAGTTIFTLVQLKCIHCGWFKNDIMKECFDGFSIDNAHERSESDDCSIRQRQNKIKVFW